MHKVDPWAIGEQSICNYAVKLEFYSMFGTSILTVPSVIWRASYYWVADKYFLFLSSYVFKFNILQILIGNTRVQPHSVST